jgi:hypothetical protein
MLSSTGEGACAMIDAKLPKSVILSRFLAKDLRVCLRLKCTQVAFSARILVEKPRYGIETQTFSVGPSPKAAQDDSLYMVSFSPIEKSLELHEHYCLLILLGLDE